MFSVAWFDVVWFCVIRRVLVWRIRLCLEVAATLGVSACHSVIRFTIAWGKVRAKHVFAFTNVKKQFFSYKHALFSAEPQRAYFKPDF